MNHMLGPREATQYFQAKVLDMDVIPFLQEDLQDGRMLMLGTPLSILDMQRMYPQHIRIACKDLKKNPALKEKVDLRWHLFDTNHFWRNMSTAYNYSALRQCLKERDQVVPKAVEVVQFALLMNLVCGIRLLDQMTVGREIFAQNVSQFVWTSSIINGGNHIIVGNYTKAEGMEVGYANPDDMSNNLGVIGSVPIKL